MPKIENIEISKLNVVTAVRDAKVGDLVQFEDPVGTTRIGMRCRADLFGGEGHKGLVELEGENAGAFVDNGRLSSPGLILNGIAQIELSQISSARPESSESAKGGVFLVKDKDGHSFPAIFVFFAGTSEAGYMHLIGEKKGQIVRGLESTPLGTLTSL